MAVDPGLAEGLAPLLDGRFGADTRRLVLSCLSRRLTGGWSMDTAPLLALADAMDLASSGTKASQPGSSPRES